MSGTMQQMPMQAGGQLPPQVMQAMQQMQQMRGAQMQQQRPPMPMPVPGQQPQQGGAPQAAGQAPQMPQQPPIQPPVVGGAAANNPNLALFAQAAQAGRPGMQQGAPGQSRLTPQEMARMGRFGDQVVGHLSPGEITVPPELQSPKVLATLNNAFRQVGVSPQTFTAGSPQNVHNPQTGAPEFSLLGALLPVLGAVAGSFIPGIGTAAGMALGGAAGGAAGGLIDKNPTEAALGALGGAAGGYLGGSGGISSLFGSGANAAATGAADAAATGAAGSAATTAPFGAATGDAATAGQDALAARVAAGDNPAGILNTPGSITSPSAMSAAGPSFGQRLMGGLYAGSGAGIGQSFAPQPASTAGVPAGFNTPMSPLNRQYGQLLGSNQANAPQFQGYNPYTSVMGNGTYNFFPVTN